MTINESHPSDKVVIKLEFIKPWEATNTTRFLLERAGNGEQAKVTWSMEGHNDFMGKAFSLFMDMDEMVGKDFEKGLSQLDKVAEEDAKALARARAGQGAAGAQVPSNNPAAP
jgi:hypothetical protein